MAKKATNKKTNIIDFFRDKTVQFIIGVVLFFLTVYISLALVSFLYSGKADQSIIAEYNTQKQEYIDKKSHTPLTDTDKKELQNIKKELLKIQVKAENITGYRGAVISENMINNWLGLGVFFLCAFGFVCSLRLFGIKKNICLEIVIVFCFSHYMDIAFISFCA